MRMTDKAPILSKKRSFFFLCMPDMSAIQDISIWKVTIVEVSAVYATQITVLPDIYSASTELCRNVYACSAVAMVHETDSHPDAELHVFSAVDFHAFVQQANLLEVLPVDHEAANQSRASENR